MSGSASACDLVNAATMPEALDRVAEGRRPIAGGTDLMVLFEAGRLPYRELVSIRKIAALRTIDFNERHVDIGAGVTYSEIRTHPLLKSEFGLLCRAAGWTGGVANQNRGTIGGNIANASPAADSPPALLVYDAQVELLSKRGARWVPYDTFHTGYKTMLMDADELLTRIRCPRRTPQVEYSRKAGARKAQAISKLAMAAAASMNGDQISDVLIAVASVAPIPLRCHQTERVLRGATLNPQTRAAAKDALAAEISPIDDIRSTREYRLKVALNLLGEFLDVLPAAGVLAHWNTLNPETAAGVLYRCCASTQWARQLVARRPFYKAEDLFTAADYAWMTVDTADILEAFRGHPRIGDQPASSHAWAAGEQSGMNAADQQLREAMAQGNREYESRFGFIYIVCATGKSAREMLNLLERRLQNDPTSELKEAAEQQRQIMQLRLRKWLAE